MSQEYQDLAMLLLRGLTRPDLAHQQEVRGLTLLRDAWAVGIEDVGAWLEFCQEVFERSAVIARALGVPNKFRIVGEGASKRITYGG